MKGIGRPTRLNKIYCTGEIQFCQVLFHLFKLDKFVYQTILIDMSYLPSTEVKERNLTEKQQAFLDNLITTGGNPKEAAELAGYSGNYHQVIKSLREEVIQLASDVLARSAPQAAFKLVEIMNSDAPIPQVGNKLTAAQTILDRVGVAKRDRLDVTHQSAGGIFILPEKQPIEAESVEIIED